MADLILNRRDVIRGTLGGAAALSLGLRPSFVRADDTDMTGKPKPGKIGDFKISLAQWSLHKALFGQAGEKMDNLDFPRMAREKFDISGIELVNQFFKDKPHDSAYLRDLKKRADDHGVTCVLIMIDGEGDLSSPDKSERAKAVFEHSEWVDAAAELGCHSIRVNTGSHYSPTNVGDAADACRKLTEYGEAHKINIICENHGGPSSNPDALLALIKKVNHPRFGTLPDFGNFPNKKEVYAPIARMMPYAKGVSAKSYDFGPEGKETVLDYARIMKIVTDSGYMGWVGIEYEGDRLPEPAGIMATKKLLESLRGSEYKG